MFRKIIFKIRKISDLNLLLIGTYLVCFLAITFNILGLEFSQTTGNYNNLIGKINNLYDLGLKLINLLRLSSGEEFIFRLLPLFVILNFIKSKYDNNILYIMILSSIIFGYLHGNIYNIFIQGITGFTLFIIFYKNYLLHKNLTFAFIKIAIIHFLFNLTIFSIDFIKT